MNARPDRSTDTSAGTGTGAGPGTGAADTGAATGADAGPDATLARRTRKALGALRLPDGTALAGRLAGLTVARGRINVALRVTAGEAARLAPLRAAAEARLRALPGAAQATVVLTADAPAPPPAAPKPAAGGPPPRPELLPGVAQVVAVASGKGGVGKSTTAVNLALALRAEGLRVGLLDADVHGPSLPTLLGLHGKPRLGADRRLLPMEAHGLRAMSIGLLIDAEAALVWRGPMVMSALTQMLAEVDWGALDILLVDMPPGTGDAQLAIAQSVRLAGAVIVSTPQDLSLIDARRGITMFRKIAVPVLGIVENMAHFLCPTCGAEHAIFGAGGARAEAARQGVPFLGAVPLTMELRAASDAGQPLVARDPDGPLGRLYLGLARALRGELARHAPARPVPPAPSHGGSR